MHDVQFQVAHGGMGRGCRADPALSVALPRRRVPLRAEAQVVPFVRRPAGYCSRASRIATSREGRSRAGRHLEVQGGAVAASVAPGSVAGSNEGVQQGAQPRGWA